MHGGDMQGSLATFGWRPRRAAHLTPLGSLLAVTAIVAALLMVGMPRPAAPAGDGAPVAVIVRKLPGAGVGPERLVERLGGQVQHRLAIIDGFSALVPADQVATLRHSGGVSAVSPNGRVKLMASAYDGVDPASTMDKMTA